MSEESHFQSFHKVLDAMGRGYQMVRVQDRELPASLGNANRAILRLGSSTKLDPSRPTCYCLGARIPRLVLHQV